jgi:hypothetical protein
MSRAATAAAIHRVMTNLHHLVPGEVAGHV